VTPEDEAFDALDRRLNRKVDQDDDIQVYRNDVLEEVARAFEKMPFGDTSSSFALYVRNMKR
jgi:hypothetical protein